MLATTHNTFTSEIEYSTAKEKLTAYDNSVRSWLTEHKTNGIRVEIASKMPYASEVNNDLRSMIEVWEFINNPPNKYFLYINEKESTAITWTGSVLGKVTFGKKYKCSFGDTRQSIRISAINGLDYYGTYFKSSGTYARIKATKHKTAL